MATERHVHQVRLLLSLLPDSPTLMTGYGVDRRLIEQDEWETYATVAFAHPCALELGLIESMQEVVQAARELPQVLPFD